MPNKFAQTIDAILLDLCGEQELGMRNYKSPFDPAVFVGTEDMEFEVTSAEALSELEKTDEPKATLTTCGHRSDRLWARYSTNGRRPDGLSKSTATWPAALLRIWT